MRVATTFSGGFGSVEFALKYLNIPHEVVFACEWMKPQMESYLLNHGEPTSNFYEDIRDLDGTKYKDEVFYLHESPPCQSYSLAGSRGGAADERGGLMYEAIKKIDEIQPKMFSVENVRGLLSANDGEDWKNILRDFKSLKGYTISWGIMNAKEQDTPQNRERVFIVGFRGKAPQMSFPKRVSLTRVLRDVLEDEVDEKYFLSDKQIENFITSEFNQEKSRLQTKEYCDALLSRDWKSPKLVQVGNIDQQGHNSLWGRVYDVDGIAPTQNAKGGGAGAKTGLFLVQPFIVASRGRNPKNASDRTVGAPTQQRLEPKFDGTTNALTTVQKDNLLVYQDRIRRLTPRECARVQGDFQDMFKFGTASDTKLYEFIGNAMDISTTKNLILKMLEHCKIIDFTEPNEPSFEMSTKEKAIDTLF